MMAVQIHLNRRHSPANPAAIPVRRTRTRNGYITRVDRVESTTSERIESGDVSRRRRSPIDAEAPWARTKPITEVTCRKTSQAYGMDLPIMLQPRCWRADPNGPGRPRLRARPAAPPPPRQTREPARPTGRPADDGRAG